MPNVMPDVIAAIVICFIIYRIATMGKRRKKRKEAELLQMQALEQKRNAMLSDPKFLSMAEALCENVTDLKAASVKNLRVSGKFWLLFIDGSVYYETRWKERTSDGIAERKNTQLILDRLNMGKNPMTEQENKIFADFVYKKLSEVSWLSVSNNYSVRGLELKVEKTNGAVIPEASV